ncbi:hypothetical protein BB559_006319 [Furculomyces boomerangus]|uniref:WH2 domain-containing protein n=2 Tax=Harpellales TaxID=61421 RepID=A0A2T9XXH6_9FUNG|nr:hypothetical protein BB559_007393 [Furculomyces boomerangus]PVU86933.1 hypothetical protein BB559_006319 [Furculomyces boomerangus]PWA00142.1 hypothetical protein BB558_003814 [Smittium angustum]
MADRNALLKQIQSGKKLKKAITNDRSTPLIAKPSSTIQSSNLASTSSTGSTGSYAPPSGSPAQATVGIGNIFAGGIPKLKHVQGGFGSSKKDSNEKTPDQNTPNKIPSFNSNNDQANRFKKPTTNSSNNASNNFSSGNVPKPGSYGLPKVPITNPSNQSNQKSFAKEPSPPLQSTNFSQSDNKAPQRTSSPAGFAKRKPPPPPPNKAKPPVIPGNKPSRPVISSNPQFSTAPRSKFNSLSSPTAADKIFENNNPGVNRIHNRTPSVPNIVPNPTNGFAPTIPTREMNWDFHSIDLFPKLQASEKSKIGGHVYPSGNKYGSSIPLKF